MTDVNAPLTPEVSNIDDALAALQSGNLSLSLAKTAADIDAAQALRYRVFYEEMAAKPSAEAARLKRDIDRFDAVCDHLLVSDRTIGEGPAGVVATYRLLRGSVATEHGRFYTSGEYDIANLYGFPGEMLELGRSCVEAASRDRPTMQLLWRGIAAYVFHHDISLMFGCGSLHGTDPAALALPLSYLYHFHLAPPALRTKALPELYVDMNFLALEEIDPKKALASLPPLVKGYLRLGGFVGDGAVVDEQFNTTDVCVVVKTDLVTEKYYRHYSRTSTEAGAGPAAETD
ncbi:MAG: GNAT family N-acetyltransferase [Alphaproteobacteria bacterium]|nr:GNAT family N-acetyltransferase [Alphaproteobacteria bacterium]